MLALNTKTEQEQSEITNDLRKVSKKNKNPSLPYPFEDHNYSDCEDTSLTLDQQYTNDIGWTSTAEHIIENIEKNTEKLKERNILINQFKTEKNTT